MNDKKAVIYIKANNPQSDTDKQVQKCRVFADENCIEVVEVIADFEGIFEHGINRVIVDDFSRISRNVRELILIDQSLKEKGIFLISAENGMFEFINPLLKHNNIDKLKRQN